MSCSTQANATLSFDTVTIGYECLSNGYLIGCLEDVLMLGYYLMIFSLFALGMDIRLLQPEEAC